MASEQVSNPIPAAPLPPQLQALQAWLARLGLSGKLLTIGGLAGVIAVFLPLLSMSIQMQTPAGGNPFGGKGIAVNLLLVSSNQSVMVLRDWRGVLCLVGYLAALALAFLLYPSNGLGQKGLAWSGLGVGALIALLALWLLVLAFNGSSGMTGFGGSFQISVGSGAILNLLAAAAVAVGAFLKAREEIFPARLVLLDPQERKAYVATLAQETAITAVPASTNVATAQPPPLVAAIISKQPPPLPIAQAPAADACDSREHRKGGLTVPGRTAGRSVPKPSGGFPVVLAFGIGGSVVLGVIVGLMMWKFRSADPQPTNRAIVKNVPGKQDNDPAGKESEPGSEPGNEVTDQQDNDPAPTVPLKKKGFKPGNDMPVNQDSVPTALLKEKESKPGNNVPDKQDKEPAPAVLLKAKESKPDVPAARQRRLDLMSIVDLNQDLVEGKNKWRLQNQTLICTTGHFVPRVQIRFVPPEEYDFSVTFTQTKLRNGVSLIMPKPDGGMFFWTVGFRHGSGYGFGPDGKERGGNVAKLIQTNRMYTTTVQVRRNGVKGLLDGRLLVNHPTDFRDLNTDHWRRMPNDRVLGVACDDPTTFYRIHLVEVTGKGKAIR